MNSSVNYDGEVYWASISRSLWAASTGWKFSSQLVVYYRIIAYDADNDRPNDSISEDTGVQQAGIIVDDDSEGPIIHNIYFEDMDMDGILESDETFKIVVEASDESGIRNVTVKVYFEGSLVVSYVYGYGIIYEDGKYVTASIGPLPSGNVTIIVEAEDDDSDRDEYDTSWSNDTALFEVQLEKIFVTISPTNVHVDYGDNLLLSLYVEDSDGNYAIDNVPIVIRVYNSTDVVFETVVNATLYVTEYVSIPTNLSAGAWNIMVEAGDDSYFERTSKLTKVFVHQDTSMEMFMDYDRLVQYEDVIITVSLYAEDGSPLPYRNVTLYIGAGDTWQEIGQAFTNESGIAIVSWEVGISIGRYYIKAVFDGEEYYYGSEVTRSVEIVESEAQIAVLAENKTVVCVYSDSANITLKLYNWRTNEPISSEKIDIIIITENSEILLGSGITKSDGTVVVVISSIGLQPGTYLAIAKWGGNSKYASTQTRFTLLVTKESIGNIDITLSPETVQYSDTMSIVLYVTDDDGNPVESASVTIEIYEGEKPIDSINVDVKNGTAEASWSVLGVSYAPQTLSMNVVVSENDYYYGSSKKITFDVEQEKISVVVNVEGDIIVGEEVKIVVAVVDDDNVPVDYIDVKVYIDDVLFDEDTAINGRLEVSWTPSHKGMIKIKVVVGEENPCYEKVEKEIKIDASDKAVAGLLQNLVLGAVSGIFLIGLVAFLRKKKKGTTEEIEAIEEATTEEAVEETESDVGEFLEEL